ncbi:MAG: hypothetical protein Q7R41_13905, partial [Phycisphaerales bacterium]|nr:hypothetical protein [Phycisphaerales bacterium]
TDEEMLRTLKELLTRHGRISGLLIDEQEGLPSSAAFRHRFGSLIRAYQLVGYTPKMDLSFRAINRFLREKHPEIVQQVITRLAAISVSVERDPATDLLVLDHELAVSIVLARCLRTEAGGVRWLLRFENSLRPDLTIAVRLDEANQAIKDYYLFPAIDRGAGNLRLNDCNHALLDAYRFDDLEFFFAIAERIPVEEVA